MSREREASGSPPALVGGRWSVHEAREGDDAELLALFEEVFGHRMPSQQWRWKYADAPMRGTLIRRGCEVVGFFGGMPRPVQGPQRVHLAVQNGDVMVKPCERGVFTRRGAFYHVCKVFFAHYVGPGRSYEFAIGFPSQRHLDLGLKLGLYIEGERMKTLRWTPLSGRSGSWWWRATALSAEDLGAVDALWQTMRRDWSGRFIPVRDAVRWRYRFLDHPTYAYQLLLLRRRLDGKPLAAVALREHAEHVEWLDYVGPGAQVPRAVAAARLFAGACGGKPLSALCSQSIAPAFAVAAATVEDSMIGIPLKAPEPGWPQPYPWQGKLWLMGGDSDYM